MTLLTDTPADITADARAGRLDGAGQAWSGRIDADRAAAHLTYRVRGEGQGAVATRITAGRHEFLVDEPAALAGDDVAASPVEYALGALISCQVVVYRLYANALGIPFDDIAITATGHLDAARLFGKDDAVRAGFQSVELDVRITGPESQERYEHLASVVDAHCPVLDLFSNPTPVTSTVASV
ncbi:OsmC family protein [Microbacterium aquimaris]|uniref:OsmC family protein n=1 Tax=Microbacterium aquimaris TaxID=459816 RepID=A0ABU5N715_9MICO|nr:OsmC family protein [Microbacterium aquimaris]MDZ8161875.1 OsmC family protein [Microbacterium aquimaris]MDZ8275549.1 OsmC family protein [Microbacterium aquimaris]